jgi:hypothetical protein
MTNSQRMTIKLLSLCAPLCVIVLWCVIAAPLVSHAQQTSEPATSEGRKLPLKQQLTLGLKATTKEDKEFINNVVLKVEQGTIPRPLVDSTFLWAREKANRKSASRSLRPIVYFRPGLIARAKILHLTL